jgi:hypothetical protein
MFKGGLEVGESPRESVFVRVPLIEVKVKRRSDRDRFRRLR